MKKIMVQILVTGTTEVPIKEFQEKFDPLLLQEATLLVSSMLGCECCVTVEDMELVAVESLDDDEEEE